MYSKVLVLVNSLNLLCLVLNKWYKPGLLEQFSRDQPQSDCIEWLVMPIKDWQLVSDMELFFFLLVFHNSSGVRIWRRILCTLAEPTFLSTLYVTSSYVWNRSRIKIIHCHFNDKWSVMSWYMYIKKNIFEVLLLRG